MRSTQAESLYHIKGLGYMIQHAWERERGSHYIGLPSPLTSYNHSITFIWGRFLYPQGGISAYLSLTCPFCLLLTSVLLEKCTRIFEYGWVKGPSHMEPTWKVIHPHVRILDGPHKDSRSLLLDATLLLVSSTLLHTPPLALHMLCTWYPSYLNTWLSHIDIRPTPNIWLISNLNNTPINISFLLNPFYTKVFINHTFGIYNDHSTQCTQTDAIITN